MNPKMKSAIEKITLNDATFSNEVIEPTYVNFFYGKNGAGKSTIARTFKANDEHLQWQAGRASTDYDVLVYDTDFINANLRNYGNLAGVFTVNETNAIANESTKIYRSRDLEEAYRHIKKNGTIVLATKTDGMVNWCELYAVTEGDIIPVITSNDGSKFTINFSNKTIREKNRIRKEE